MTASTNGVGVIPEVLQTPFGPYLSSFSTSLRKQGYLADSILRKTRVVAHLCLWLQQRCYRLCDLGVHVEQFLRYRTRRHMLHRGDAAALRTFSSFLCDQGVIRAQEFDSAKLPPVEKCVKEYERYLREDRALARETVVKYVYFSRIFLKERFGRGQAILSKLRASDVVEFLRHQVSRHPKEAKPMITSLRSFLRYARYRGETTCDLAAAIPAASNWRMTSIPQPIPVGQVRELLRKAGRRTAVQRRNYAILLLLARLGVRAGEVVTLKLDDVDWKYGRLSVHGKCGKLIQLPLPKDVGKAIAAYLQNGRPINSCRRVFLRSRAPFRGLLRSSSVSTIVRRALKRAGICAPTNGSHQFRHGLATEMLRRGASLSEIGELLGHESSDTTKIYTKVDLGQLRALALPWPGDVR